MTEEAPDSDTYGNIYSSDGSFNISSSDEILLPRERVMIPLPRRLPVREQSSESSSEFDISYSDEEISSPRTVSMPTPRPFRVLAKSGAAEPKPEFDISSSDEPDEECVRTIVPEPDQIVEHIMLKFRDTPEEEFEQPPIVVPEKSWILSLANHMDFVVKMASMVFLSGVSLKLFLE